jgi:hypothetical protein
MTGQPEPLVIAKAYISHTQYQTVITNDKYSPLSDEALENGGADTGMDSLGY